MNIRQEGDEKIYEFKGQDIHIKLLPNTDAMDIEAEIANIKFALYAITTAIKDIRSKVESLMQLCVTSTIMNDESKQEIPQSNVTQPVPQAPPTTQFNPPAVPLSNLPGDLRKISMKYNGKCAGCGRFLKAGFTGHYSPSTKKVYCYNCVKRG